MLTGEGVVILEKRMLAMRTAATQLPPLCVHDAKPVTVFEFHALETVLGAKYTTHPASQSVVVVLTYLRNRLYFHSVITGEALQDALRSLPSSDRGEEGTVPDEH